LRRRTPGIRTRTVSGPGLSIAALCVASCDEVAVGAVDEIHRRVALGELREPDGFADSDQVSWLRDLAPASIRTHPRAQRAGTSPSRTARTESSSHPTSRHIHPCRALTPNASGLSSHVYVAPSTPPRASSSHWASVSSAFPPTSRIAGRPPTNAFRGFGLVGRAARPRLSAAAADGSPPQEVWCSSLGSPVITASPIIAVMRLSTSDKRELHTAD
jgi:hypothetical protein